MDTTTKGILGEDIASRFLEREGFTLIARNYRKKWGELDVIGTKNRTLHFFEVKSITGMNGRPEENVHDFKMRQIRRMIQTYLAESGRGAETEFYFHVICVFMDLKTRRARIKWIKNVII